MAKPNTRREIQDAAKILAEVMRKNMTTIAAAMIKQIMSRVNSLPDSMRFNALNNITKPGINVYKDELLTALAVIAGSAIDSARREVPAKRNVKLAEWPDDMDGEIMLSKDKDITHLWATFPKDVRDRITTQMQVLVQTQMNDLDKAIFFQFGHSIDSTDSMSLLQRDLFEAAEDAITSTAIETGATSIGAQIINEARHAFFFDKDVIAEVEAFEFVNGDPVSPICQDLAGTVFAKDDPELFRYTPPLHWRCKSYIRPILVGNLRGREISKLRPSEAALEKFIQFSECGCSVHLAESLSK